MEHNLVTCAEVTIRIQTKPKCRTSAGTAHSKSLIFRFPLNDKGKRVPLVKSSQVTYSSSNTSYLPLNREIPREPRAFFIVKKIEEVRSAFFCYFTQSIMVMAHRRFGTNYQSHLRGSSSPRRLQ
jgi:hypothetical protein